MVRIHLVTSASYTYQYELPPSFWVHSFAEKLQYVEAEAPNGLSEREIS